MEDTVIIVKHPSYPGAFHFRGYLSEEHFLQLNTNHLNELEITIFGEILWLPVDECVIEFRGIV